MLAAGCHASEPARHSSSPGQQRQPLGRISACRNERLGAEQVNFVPVVDAPGQLVPLRPMQKSIRSPTDPGPSCITWNGWERMPSSPARLAARHILDLG